MMRDVRVGDEVIENLSVYWVGGVEGLKEKRLV